MITVLVWSVQYLKNDESYLKELCHEIYHEIQTVRADNKLSNLNMYLRHSKYKRRHGRKNLNKIKTDRNCDF